MALLKSINSKRSLEYSQTDKSIYFNVSSKDEIANKSMLQSSNSKRIMQGPIKANYQMIMGNSTSQLHKFNSNTRTGAQQGIKNLQPDTIKTFSNQSFLIQKDLCQESSQNQRRPLSSKPKLASQSVKLQQHHMRKHRKNQSFYKDRGSSPENTYLSPGISQPQLQTYQSSSKIKKPRPTRPLTAVPLNRGRDNNQQTSYNNREMKRNSVCNTDKKSPPRYNIGGSQKRRPLTAYRKKSQDESFQDGLSRTDLNTVDISLRLQERIQKDKKAISEYTYYQNQEIDDVIQKLREVEKIQMQKNEPYKNIENINCKELLQKTNRDIKGLNYDLQRVIAAEEFFHTNIPIRKIVDIEVLQQNYMYFKIQTKGSFCPLKFFINYKEQEINKGRKTDLRMYFSFTSKEPNENDYQKYFLNPKKKVVIPSNGNAEQFTQDWIYFSLFSLTGCSLQVQVTFPEEIKKTKKKVQNEDRQDTSLILRAYKEYDEKPDKDVYLEIKNKWNRITGDFVTQNIKQINKWEETVFERRLKTRESIERISVAKMRQKDLETQNMKMKYFLVHRWEFIKEKKKHYEEFIQSLKKERNLKRKWVQQVKTYEFLKQMFSVYSSRQQEVRREQKMERSASGMAQLFRKYSNRIANGRPARTSIRAKNVFTYASTFINDVAQENFKTMMKLFLRDTSEKFELKSKMIHFYKQIMYIQQVFRVHMSAFQCRCDVLIEIWDRELTQLIKECILKKTKKKTALMKKLNLIPDDIKLAVISAYLQRCKLKYQASYCEWRLHIKYTNTQDPKAREQQVMKLIRKKDILYAQESLLFKGIDFTDDTISAINPTNVNANSNNNNTQMNIGSKKQDSKAVQSSTKGGARTQSKGKEQVQQKQPQAVQPQKVISQAKQQAILKKAFDKDQPPAFRFIPRKDLIRQLIIRATQVKNVKDLKF